MIPAISTNHEAPDVGNTFKIYGISPTWKSNKISLEIAKIATIASYAMSREHYEEAHFFLATVLDNMPSGICVPFKDHHNLRKIKEFYQITTTNVAWAANCCRLLKLSTTLQEIPELSGLENASPYDLLTLKLYKMELPKESFGNFGDDLDLFRDREHQKRFVSWLNHFPPQELAHFIQKGCQYFFERNAFQEAFFFVRLSAHFSGSVDCSLPSGASWLATRELLIRYFEGVNIPLDAILHAAIKYTSSFNGSEPLLHYQAKMAIIKMTRACADKRRGHQLEKIVHAAILQLIPTMTSPWNCDNFPICQSGDLILNIREAMLYKKEGRAEEVLPIKLRGNRDFQEEFPDISKLSDVSAIEPIGFSYKFKDQLNREIVIRHRENNGKAGWNTSTLSKEGHLLERAYPDLLPHYATWYREGRFSLTPK